MLQAVEFPAGIAHLDSGLADVYGYYLAHDDDLVELIWSQKVTDGFYAGHKTEVCLTIESLRPNSKTRMVAEWAANESRVLKSGGGVLNSQALCRQSRMAEQKVKQGVSMSLMSHGCATTNFLLSLVWISTHHEQCTGCLCHHSTLGAN